MEDIFTFFRQETILSSGVLIVLIVGLVFFINRLSWLLQGLVIRHIAGKTLTAYDDEITKIVGVGIRRLILIVGIYFSMQQFDWIWTEESSIHLYFNHVLYVLAVLVVARMISKVVEVLLDWHYDRVGRIVSARLNEEFRPLLRRVIYIVVYVMAAIHILQYFDRNISSILVSLGVGSLAVALAAKDTLANMIAGFMIMTDRPFRLGDRIMLENGEKGDVYDIGLRTTKILTFDNTLIVVPNQQIINEKVTNLSYPDPQIRVSVEAGVAYGTDLNHVKALLVDICKSHPDVLENPEPAAYFLKFGDSSLDLKVVCRVSKYGEQWRVSEEIRLAIYQAFEKENIEIPFPQRVLYLKKGAEDNTDV